MKNWLERLLFTAFLFISFSFVAYDTYIDSKSYETRIIKLNQEIKSKDQQIKGLSEQVSRQTKRITELTGNGG